VTVAVAVAVAVTVCVWAGNAGTEHSISKVESVSVCVTGPDVQSESTVSAAVSVPTAAVPPKTNKAVAVTEASAIFTLLLIIYLSDSLSKGRPLPLLFYHTFRLPPRLNGVSNFSSPGQPPHLAW
jgi:hypothetical protein